MNIRYRKCMPVLAALALAMTALPAAQAACGSVSVKPSSWSPQYLAPHVMNAPFGDERDHNAWPPIVGMWHTVFTGHTQNGGPYTSPQPLDDALVVFHSDSTEIMNSARPPQDGNFCLGVWKQTGERQYLVNHLPWRSNTPDNAPGGIGYPIDGVQLTEEITLGPDGNHYSGTFKEVIYDTSGSPVVTYTGTMTATRITINTPFTSLL